MEDDTLQNSKMTGTLYFALFRYFNLLHAANLQSLLQLATTFAAILMTHFWPHAVARTSLRPAFDPKKSRELVARTYRKPGRKPGLRPGLRSG